MPDKTIPCDKKCPICGSKTIYRYKPLIITQECTKCDWAKIATNN